MNIVNPNFVFIIKESSVSSWAKYHDSEFHICQNYPNPFKNSNLVKMDKNLPSYLTLDQAEKLLEDVKTRKIFDHILIALQTGARPEEVGTLRWENVDLKHRLLKFKGKGAKERSVPIPERLFQFLNKRRKEKGLIVREPYDTSNIGKQFRIYADQFGLKKFTFKDLRHTYASWLAQKAVSIQIIKELLGHESITTTMIYAHLAPDSRMIAISAMDSILQ